MPAPEALLRSGAARGAKPLKLLGEFERLPRGENALAAEMLPRGRGAAKLRPG
jgi:hypothetical protein